MSHKAKPAPPSVSQLQLGDKVRAHPYFGNTDQTAAYIGTVIHINRRHRHFTLEFREETWGRTFRQTYYMEDKT